MTIYVPPTGNQGLDLVLEQLASNVSNIRVDTANIVTYNGDGSISAGGSIIGYRNRYIFVLFADDVYGSGQSTSPANKSYYAIVNTDDTTAPTSPLSYSYTKVSGGFGTTKDLFYKTIGGRQIQWFVGTAAPNTDWLVQPNTTTYNYIDLDNVTGTSGAPGANGWSAYQASIFQSSNTVPVAPTGGDYVFSTQTLTPPAGWFANIPTANNNVYVSTYLFTSNVLDTVTATTWDTPTAVYKFGANGANGIDGANGKTTTVGVVYQANTLTPLAISSLGYYDFANARLLAPTGWSNVIPNNTTNTTVWSSQATFVTTNAVANISNTTSWTTPALTFQSGGVGAPGTRGFIPLGYVITTGDPTAYTTAQYTAAFSASRTNTVPPIGTGYAPIAGDTAQFAGGGKSVVKSFNGTAWVTSVASVIDGSLIITGTVTAAQINTNSVYALTMRGGSVTGPTDVANVGYWIDAANGTALFTGNVVVGNLITTTAGIAKLAANSVGTANIIANSITADQIAANTITAGEIAPGTITASQIAANTITGNLIVANTITGNLLAANTITANKLVTASITATQIAANTITANNIASGTITADKLAANVLQVGNIVSFNANIGNTSSPGYWLRYDTGDAHFFGNVTIGSNLVIQGILSNGIINSNALPTIKNTNNPAGLSYSNPSTWTQFNARVDFPLATGGAIVNAGRMATITYVPKAEYFTKGVGPNRLITLTFNSTWTDPTNGTGPTIFVYLNGKTFGGTVPVDDLMNLQTNGPTSTNPNGSWYLQGKGVSVLTGNMPNGGALVTMTFTDTSPISRFFNGTNYITAMVTKGSSSTNFVTTLTNISLTVQEL